MSDEGVCELKKFGPTDRRELCNVYGCECLADYNLRVGGGNLVGELYLCQPHLMNLQPKEDPRPKNQEPKFTIWIRGCCFPDCAPTMEGWLSDVDGVSLLPEEEEGTTAPARFFWKEAVGLLAKWHGSVDKVVIKQVD